LMFSRCRWIDKVFIGFKFLKRDELETRQTNVSVRGA